MTIEAHLLSPYRPPTSYPVSLERDEAASWLCGYFALWHPAVLARVDRPPAVTSSYDHDQPSDGFIYAVPEGPHLYQPDDWMDRIRQAKAVAFKTTTDRAGTLDLVKAAFQDAEQDARLLEVSSDIVLQFAAVGYGHLIVETLFDAMDHEHLLDADGFWADVKAAVQALTEPEPARAVTQHLKNAAEKLQAAREVLNTTTVRMIDLAIPDAEKLGAAWPLGMKSGLPLTVLASGELLEQIAAEQPERFAELKAKFQPSLESAVDLCCGSYCDREDALLPVESQCWNLEKARSTIRNLFDVETEIYGRKRSAQHPQLPAWLQHYGYQKAVIVSFDGAMTPARNAVVVNWPAPDGKSLDAFGREPQTASDPTTFFNLAHTLHQAMTQDSTPTLALAHKGEPAGIGYEELVALTELAPVLGEFNSLLHFLNEYHYGDYLGTATADDFFADYLDERTTTLQRPEPVSGFARHLRLRRRLDSAATLLALHQSITPPSSDSALSMKQITELEDEIETRGVNTGPNAEKDDLSERLALVETEVAQRLADRIQVRSAPNPSGLMLFNPCGFTRRVALELDDFGGPVPIVDPIKAAEFNGNSAKIVVEIPSFGFAWIPRPTLGTNVAAPKNKMKLADGMIVRNEFFEAEIDPTSGGLRSFRDMRTRLNRIGMQPVFNPGSKSVARSVQVTNSGSALGEITAEGDLLDEHDTLLASFHHRIRAWQTRPALEIQVDLDVKHTPTGYPWHAYYGLRFGWRDDRAALFRGVNGSNTQTSYTRPVSPDYLEVRLGGERTFLFTGGLPFLQRHGTRMADVILVPEGEQARSFELLLAMDRDYPMQTAAGWVAPTPIVPTEKGPPHIGASGWLAHLDLPSLLITSLKPVAVEAGHAIAARFIECAGFGGSADLRFARDPVRAVMIDGENHELQPITLAEGVIPLEFSAGETFRVRAEWV